MQADARERELPLWHCANCNKEVQLNAHGRCEDCDSNAITTIAIGRLPEEAACR